MTYVSLGLRGSCGPIVLHVAKTGKTYHMLVTSMSSSPACPYARHKETRCMAVQMHVAPPDNHGLFDRDVRRHTGCILLFQNLSRPVIGTTFVSLHASKNPGKSTLPCTTSHANLTYALRSASTIHAVYPAASRDSWGREHDVVRALSCVWVYLCKSERGYRVG